MVVLFFMAGALSSAVLGLWIYVKWKRSLTLPPGPSGWSLLFRHFICGRPLHEELSALLPNYGELVSFLSWARPVIVLNNAYAIEQGLTGRGFTFTGRTRPTWMPGLKFRHSQRGIHELEGDEWRQLHLALSRVLQNNHESFADLVETLARPRTNVLLDLNDFCLEFCTSVFRTFFFGDSLTDDDINCSDLAMIFSVEHSLVWHYLHDNDMVSNMLRTYRGKINNLDAAVWSALQRVRELERRSETSQEDEGGATFISELLQQGLSDEAVIANLSTLLTFASVSCALQLQWCLLFFLERTIRNEINGPEDWTAFVTEVLRLRPLLPLGFPRRVLHSTQLFGYHVPRDAVVLTNIASANLDPVIWDEPLTFRPSRFEDTAAKPLSFGTGRRDCLGTHLAQQLLPRALQVIAAQFEVKAKGHVTLRPQHCGLVQQPTSASVTFVRKATATT